MDWPYDVPDLVISGQPALQLRFVPLAWFASCISLKLFLKPYLSGQTILPR